MVKIIFFTLLVLMLDSAQCHLVLTYPGWRGNNLILNGSIEDTNGLGTGQSGSAEIFPYGMQWIYPCGGMPLTSNRTQWPVAGGAVAFQPGWFTGHQHARIYVNMGFGDVPENYSVPLLPPFDIVGPSNNPYPGTLCLPQVPVPAGHVINAGDRATIQVIEAAVHGAAMYSCVDITFVDSLGGEHEVNATNCFNSTTITFAGSGGAAATLVNATRETESTSAPTQTVTNVVTVTAGAASNAMGLRCLVVMVMCSFWLL